MYISDGPYRNSDRIKPCPKPPPLPPVPNTDRNKLDIGDDREENDEEIDEKMAAFRWALPVIVKPSQTVL